VVFFTLKLENMKYKILFAICLLTTIISCKREVKSIYTYEDSNNKALLKVINTVPNALALPTSTTLSSLAVYYNSNKLTGTNISYGGVFPTLEFASVNAGTSNLFLAKILATATTPEKDVSTKTLNLEANGIYSAFIVDTFPNTDVFLIKEDLKAVVDTAAGVGGFGKYFVRLVNATPLSLGYDLFASSDNTTPITNVTYKTASNFVQLDVATGPRAFYVRKNGTTINNVGGIVSITPVKGRMYTIFSYGIEGGTGLRVTRATFYTSRFQSPL
jgi:hypothetical protein